MNSPLRMAILSTTFMQYTFSQEDQGRTDWWTFHGSGAQALFFFCNLSRVTQDAHITATKFSNLRSDDDDQGERIKNLYIMIDEQRKRAVRIVRCVEKNVAKEIWFTKSTKTFKTRKSNILQLGANLNVNGEKKNYQENLSWVL